MTKKQAVKKIIKTRAYSAGLGQGKTDQALRYAMTLLSTGISAGMAICKATQYIRVLNGAMSWPQLQQPKSLRA